MLHIGIHDGDIRRGSCQGPFDAGRREAPPPDALKATHSPVAPADLADPLCRAVGRVVVDENHLPAHRLEHRIQQLDERLDIVPLVEGRNDHGQFRPLRDWPFLGLADGCEIIRSS